MASFTGYLIRSFHVEERFKMSTCASNFRIPIVERSERGGQEKKRANRSTYQRYFDIFGMSNGMGTVYFMCENNIHTKDADHRQFANKLRAKCDKRDRKTCGLITYQRSVLMQIFIEIIDIDWNLNAFPHCTLQTHIKSMFIESIIGYWICWIGRFFYVVPYGAHIFLSYICISNLDYDDERMKWPFSQFS